MQAADGLLGRLAAEDMAEAVLAEPDRGELVLELPGFDPAAANAAVQLLVDAIDIGGERGIIEPGAK